MIKPIHRPSQTPVFKLSVAQKLVLLFGMITLMFISMPTAIILLIGTLPTITALMTNSQNASQLTIVGCFNLAGVFVCIVDLLNQYNARHSIIILDNVFNIIIMLGAAALGMILYYELPNLFVWISAASAQRRLHSINSKLERLTEDWGPEVLEDKSSK